MRRARTYHGWSQEGLATKLAKASINVGGQSGIARIERGERPTRLNEVVAIAHFLDIDLQVDLGIYGSSAMQSQAEELAMALAKAQSELDESEDALADTAERYRRAQIDYNLLEDEYSEVRRERDRLKRIRDRLRVNLMAATDERRRTELMKESDGE